MQFILTLKGHKELNDYYPSNEEKYESENDFDPPFRLNKDIKRPTYNLFRNESIK